MRKNILLVLLTLCSCCILWGVRPDKIPTTPPDERIHLIHSDVLFKNAYDPAEVLVGHVKLSHNGALLDCDSARFYRENNSFNAYGHVKMVQGDTLSLVCDTLFYDGRTMQANARGKVTLIHVKTKLVTRWLDYNRVTGVGVYPYYGTLYDADNVLTSDRGQYSTSDHEAHFEYNVKLTNPKFTLISDQLYYNTTTHMARIVSLTNIESTDKTTFIRGESGDYNTQTGDVHLFNRSQIFKNLYDIEGDSLFYDKETGISRAFGNVILNDNQNHMSLYGARCTYNEITGESEAFGNVVVTDTVNQCILKGNHCQYNEKTGYAMATDRAVVIDCSTEDTLYAHGDTLKLFSYNLNTDSVYRNIYAYNKVRMFRNDVQGVCDSLVSLQRDSCTYMYGQPILWNQGQQVVGEEIHVYNNDSTIDRIHIINQAMTIEQLDSVSYNQVSSKEMMCYMKDGELERNEAHGNVYVVYYMTEDDGNRIGLNYTETTDMKVYLEKRKVIKIWMPTSKGTIYPVTGIPRDKQYLSNFAWFDYIRPVDKDDIFEWRSKGEEHILKKTETKTVPLQKLSNIK